MSEPPINKTSDMQFSSDSLRPPPYYFWLVCFPIVNKVSPLPMTVTSLPFPLTWTTSAFFTAIFLRSRFLFSHKCHLLFDVSCILTSTKWMSWYSQTRSIYTKNFAIHIRTNRAGIRFGNPHHLIDFRRFKCFYTRYRLRPRNFRNRYPIGCTFLHAVLITD